MTWQDDPPLDPTPPVDPGPPPPGPSGPQPVASVGQTIKQDAEKYIGDNPGQGGLPDWQEAWCSDFATMIWDQAGAATDGLNSGACSFVSGYGNDHPETVHDQAHDPNYTPQVGDAVVFDYNDDPKHPYANHVALVTAVNADGTMDIISGNGGPNGVTPQHMHSAYGSKFGSESITDFVSPIAKGGTPLVQTDNSNVAIGPNQQLVATASPATLDATGQSPVTGSDSVFVGGDQAPIARHGDRTSNGGTIVDQSDEGVYSG
jgi:uncharacterized Zn-binding protein involved in type VI secretion